MINTFFYLFASSISLTLDMTFLLFFVDFCWRCRWSGGVHDTHVSFDCIVRTPFSYTPIFLTFKSSISLSVKSFTRTKLCADYNAPKNQWNLHFCDDKYSIQCFMFPLCLLQNWSKNTCILSSINFLCTKSLVCFGLIFFLVHSSCPIILPIIVVILLSLQQ